MMQNAAVAAKGGVPGLHFPGRGNRVSAGFGVVGKRTAGSNRLWMPDRGFCGGSSQLGSSIGFGMEMARMRSGMEGIFRSREKARYVRVQASGDLESVPSDKPQTKSSGNVLPYVGVACLGAILFGYHLGVVNGALEYLARDLAIVENTVLQGWVVSTLLAGATVGSFTGGALADKFGRTRTFQLDVIPLAVGAFLSATAQDVRTMIIGRLLAGIGIGISSAIVPLYISEISPTEIRGALGSINQLFICIGILMALVAGLPLAGNPLWWRTMFSIAIVPSVLMALGMAFCPESPRWLFQQGKLLQAETAIKKLYGKEKVTEVMHDLRAGGEGTTESDAGWFDLFGKRYWKVVSVGAALFLFQQLAGINAVVYYSTSVFRSAGIASDVAASALVGASNVFGTAIASSLMDKQGRKSLLITSFSGMAASMLLLSLSFTWKPLAPYSGTLAVLGTVLYVLSFSLGAGPVPALLLPEIFASRIRAKAVALSLGMHWVSNFVIGLYFLSVVNKFGISRVYLGFATVCLLAVLYIAGNVVETKGRSLEEIERALSREREREGRRRGREICMADPESSSLLRAPIPVLDPNEIDLEAGPGEQFQCRICLETDGGRDFIAPCKCKGTSKYVHRECLDHWRSVKEGFAFSHCTTCKAPYYLRVHVHADRKWRTLKFRFFVTRDILSIFAVVQLIISLLAYLVFLVDSSQNSWLRLAWGFDSKISFYYVCGALLFFALLGLSGCFITCYDRRVRNDLAQPCRELCLCCCQPGMCADCHLPGTLCMWTDCTTCFESCASTAGECGCLGGAGEAGLPLLFIIGLIILGLFTIIGIFYSVLVATMVGQRIWQRHYHILAKRMLTKEYVVEDVDGEGTDWCPPPLPAEHVQQLKTLGLL
ncbi:unnamed protein product [Musa acuminata var. zebrina]